MLFTFDTYEEKTQFEQLYQLYRDKMYHCAYSVLRDEGLAEDAVQRTFIKIANHLHKIQDITSFQTQAFLSIAVKNLSKTMLQERTRMNVIAFEKLGEYPADYNTTEIIVDSRENLLRLSRYIYELNTDYRDVLLLKYVNGFNEKEMASILGIAYSNVRKRLERARKKLYDRLVREEAENNEARIAKNPGV